MKREAITWNGDCQTIEEALIDALFLSKKHGWQPVRAEAHPESVRALAVSLGWNTPKPKLSCVMLGDGRARLVSESTIVTSQLESVILRGLDGDLKVEPNGTTAKTAMLFDADGVCAGTVILAT